jgi:AAA domain
VLLGLELHQVVRSLRKWQSRPVQIVVAVPYLQQRQLYLETVIDNKEWKDLVIATTNIYQGHENIFVFCDSTAAENLEGKVGFIDDSNRLAVATTRHQCELVLFGDSRIYNNVVITTDVEEGEDSGSEDDEDEVDEVEKSNRSDQSTLQELFKWFANKSQSSKRTSSLLQASSTRK